jgi:hypothetical protein
MEELFIQELRKFMGWSFRVDSIRKAQKQNMIGVSRKKTICSLNVKKENNILGYVHKELILNETNARRQFRMNSDMYSGWWRCVCCCVEKKN